MDRALKILLVGDVMLGRLVNDVLAHAPADYPWGDVLPIFEQADWRLLNLECVISDHGSPWDATPKVFHFRSDAKNVAALQAARIDAVSLANNHALDFGYEALFECEWLLDSVGILRAGAGRNLAEASAPAIAAVHGTNIGLIAFTDNEPAWEATNDRPGVFHVPADLDDPRAARLLDLVEATKRRVDALIVSAHWGGNWGRVPPKEHVRLAHALIDRGAGVIFGHSPHVFRGVEIYRDRPILYSAGDFVDDYVVHEDERNDESFAFLLEFRNGMIDRLRLYPTMIRRFQAVRARPDEAERIAFTMTRLCDSLGTRTVWNAVERCLEAGPSGRAEAGA